MGVKDQLNKLKDNWLIIVLVVVLLLISGGLNTLSSFSGGLMGKEYSMTESLSAVRYYDDLEYYPQPSSDFAPEVEERVITKTASLSTEIERGEFQDAESKVKTIATASEAFILNENVRKYGEGRKAYYTATYQIKVDVLKYDAVISQLNEIGEVQIFNENTQDITGTYTNLQTEIEVEKERLKRYEQMFEKADEVADQIELNDRIFNQERTIKYLEQRLETMGQRVDYSTITLTMTEKRSDYIDVVFVKFSELVEDLVNSFNALLHIASYIIPWAIAYLLVRFAMKRIKRK